MTVAGQRRGAVIVPTKPGRNSPCPCGSARKYKSCCLSNEVPAPAVPAQIILTALTHHKGGDLRRAEELYRQVLEIEPGNMDALHLLGILASQVGNYNVAADFIKRAIVLDGSVPQFHLNLGNVLQAQGSLSEAISSYRTALRLRPQFPEAHNNLGTALRTIGDVRGASQQFQEALRLQPDYADAHYNFGLALYEERALAKAIGHFREALRLRPDYAEAHLNLGMALQAQGDLTTALASFAEAARFNPDNADARNALGSVHLARSDLKAAAANFQEALRLRPDFAEAHTNLGHALHAQGDILQAMVHFREARRLQPDSPEAHNNLGVALRDQGDLEGAEDSFRQALYLKSDFAEAQSNLGAALRDRGDLLQAIASFREALRLQPDNADVHNNLGTALQEQGDFPAAHAHHREAFRLRPEHREALHHLVFELQYLCDWSELPELWERTREMIGVQSAAISPFTVLAIPSSPVEQLTYARDWFRSRLAPFEAIREELHFSFEPGPKDHLRIGYLSSDFHDHATAYLVAELFELHDRSRVEVFAYSIGPDDASAMRQRLVQGVDHFVDLHPRSHLAAATQIYQNQIDILVDLKGYTQGCRTEIVALRPAPIQVNYLGYPGTMGAPFIDYLLTDAFLTPPESQPFFDETFVYLPDCYQPNDRQRPVAAETPSREEVGLPAEGFVFCCFNNAYKLTPEVFTIWMRLLQQVPGSVLWLLEANPWMVENLRGEAARREVDPTRLVFAPRLPLPQHLARHRLADLFLDTVPVNAHTTASDALWMGLPVLTCAGETFASRVAGSLLTALGLPQLITTSLEGYEELALQLAQHPSELAALREQLRLNRDTAPLFDTPRFTQNLEAAYRQMWEDLVSQQTRLAG
jgi:protein O-GlcNAc transferase